MDRQQGFLEFEKSFWKLSRKMGYQWKRIYEETFPGSQSHILFLIERNGPKKMSEVAEALQLTPGAVTTASDQLIKQGYLARSRDESDRRIVHLDLTEKGKSTLYNLQIKGRQIMNVVFNDLKDDELNMLNTIFNHANINLDNIRKERV